ncbi:MAG: RNA polymerase sigma factor [Acidobacteriota bacterium]
MDDRTPETAPDALLEALYDRHAAAIHGWCLGMLGRREDAEDAVQAIWLRLARRPRRLIAATDRTAYLWACVRHHVTSVLRRRRLERLWTPPLDPDAAELVLVGPPDAERRDLLRAVRRLAPKYRGVVLLVSVGGCTLDEAARRLGIPRGTAASRHHTALGRLQHLLRRR